MKYISKAVFILIACVCCSSAHELSRPTQESITETEQLKHSTDSVTPKKSSKKYPKNIILLIGDGMGLTQITAGLYSNNNTLFLEKFKNIGLHKCYASDDLITDSAAGATAFACGAKTYNGAVGVDANKNPVTSILEEAEQHNKATGLVSTSTIVHATPGAFIAHQESRRNYEAIAADFLKTDIDVFIGGGKKYFTRRETDERNLYTELSNKGYLVKDYFDSALSDIELIKNQKFAFLTADDDPLPVLQGRSYLEQASLMAIEQLNLNSQKGFFLMIEGAQIDWGGHANNSDYIISEMLEFDKTIGAVLDWAIKDQNTLVIVTADHETGGYAINGGEMNSLETAFTSTYHTADLIPVFAYGPGSENFGGIYDNTAIHTKMREAFKFDQSNP